MATLAPRGRISVEDVDEEIQQLQADWHEPQLEGSCEALCRRVLGDERFEEKGSF